VEPGIYRVTASATGFYAAQSREWTVPADPPACDLDVTFRRAPFTIAVAGEPYKREELTLRVVLSDGTTSPRRGGTSTVTGASSDRASR
jgi:hypothetical protein